MSDITVTKWVGWVWFAAIVMLIAGVFDALHGLAAIFAPGSAYFVQVEGGLLLFDVQGWGWWHLIAGALLILVGIFLLLGATWARITAIVLVAINAIGQITLISVQPWLSLALLAVDILVIYALTVHGREIDAKKA